MQYPHDYLGIPLVIKALFGLQFLQISQKGDKSFSWRKEIKKGDGILVNYFTNEKYKFVSGVFFSDKTVLNHSENIGDDCIFIQKSQLEGVHRLDAEYYHPENWKQWKDYQRSELAQFPKILGM